MTCHRRTVPNTTLQRLVSNLRAVCAVRTVAETLALTKADLSREARPERLD